MEIIADYHTHTRYSHGRGTVAENARAAAARGLDTVGIADHGPRSYPWIRAGPADLRAMIREVGALNRDGGLPVRVLAGVEANVVGVDGALDVPEEILRDLDVVLAGLHPTVIPPTLRDGWSLIVLNWLGKISGVAQLRARNANTKAVVEAVHRHEIDILTHPGWGLNIDTRELARACARRETAMEINASHGQMTVEYCRVAAREGCYFSLGSDAHRPEDVGRLEPALKVAAAAGLRPEQVLNAKGGPGLVKRKARAGARPAAAGAAAWERPVAASEGALLAGGGEEAAALEPGMEPGMAPGADPRLVTGGGALARGPVEFTLEAAADPGVEAAGPEAEAGDRPGARPRYPDDPGTAFSDWCRH